MEAPSDTSPFSGEYRWISYEGADTTSDLFGKGLRSLGLHPKANVCIYADTRSEWFLSAIACFQQGINLIHTFKLCFQLSKLGINISLIDPKSQVADIQKWEFSFVSHFPLLEIPLLSLKC